MRTKLESNMLTLPEHEPKTTIPLTYHTHNGHTALHIHNRHSHN